MTGRYLVLGIVIFLLVLRKKIYPPLWLFLYLFIDPIESRGIFGAIHIPIIYRIIGAFLITSAFISFSQLWKRRRVSKGDFCLFLSGSLIVMLLICMAISRFLFNTNDFLYLFESPPFVGPYSMLIVFAYYKDLRAHFLFLIYLFSQIALAAILIAFPGGPLSIFNASNYGFELFKNDPSLFGGLTNISETYGTRLSGQFINTIQLSFYNAIALAVGFYIIKVSRSIFRLAIGILFVLISCWLQLVTATRGIMTGIFFAYLFLLVHLKGVIKTVLIVLVLIIASHIFSSYTLSLSSIEIFDPVVKRFQNISNEPGIEYRLAAIEEFNYHILEHPVFGYGDFNASWEALGLYTPHQAPLEFAIIYGIPAGVILTIIILLGLIPCLRPRRIVQSGNDIKGHNLFFDLHKRNLCIIFILVNIFLVMTNSFGGKALTWIVFAMGVCLWAEQK